MFTAARPETDTSKTEPLLRPKMSELDTLRGIAVLLVMFFHGFGFRYGLQGLSGVPRLLVAVTLPGWVGVQLFFVLSGFLITGILLDTKERKDYYRRFYSRRALRILPLYYAVLALLMLLSRTGLIARHVSWPFLGLCCLYLANLTELFGIPMQYGVLWSLAVEEHFYLVWPAVVRRLSRQKVVFCSIAICVISPVARAITFLLGYSQGVGYTWLVADSLAAGALLAGLARGPIRDRRSMLRMSLFFFALAGGLAIVGLPFGIFLSRSIVGLALRDTMLGAFFFAVIAAVLVAGTGTRKRWVQIPVLQFLGAVSYGLYLFHMLAFEIIDHLLLRIDPALLPAAGHFRIMLIHFIPGTVLAISVAYLSRRFFEERFLRLKEGFEAKTSHAPITGIMPTSSSDDTSVREHAATMAATRTYVLQGSPSTPA
jgi:peptidoglycan/LPS O-acetylase OafA/YrhL